MAEAGDLLDSCVLGWDSVNEPDAGLVEVPDLNDFPPSQEFRYAIVHPTSYLLSRLSWPIL